MLSAFVHAALLPLSSRFAFRPGRRCGQYLVRQATLLHLALRKGNDIGRSCSEDLAIVVAVAPAAALRTIAIAGGHNVVADPLQIA